MAYGIGLKFDNHTENMVTDIWRRLSDLGYLTALLLDGYVPHITMAQSEGLRVDLFIDAIRNELKTPPKIQMQFSSVSLFVNPEVIMYYGVTPTAALLRLHSTSCALFQKYATNLNPLYQPDMWVPHCSLAVVNNEEKLKEGIDISRTLTLPHFIPSVEYVIVEHDGQRAEILESFSLY